MKIVMVDVCQRQAIEEHRASVGVIKALYEVDDGGLAPARGAHQRHLLPWLHLKADALQHLNSTHHSPVSAPFRTFSESYFCIIARNVNTMSTQGWLQHVQYVCSSGNFTCVKSALHRMA